MSAESQPLGSEPHNGTQVGEREKCRSARVRGPMKPGYGARVLCALDPGVIALLSKHHAQPRARGVPLGTLCYVPRPICFTTQARAADRQLGIG